MNIERILELIYTKFDKFNSEEYLKQRPITFCNQFVTQIAEGFGHMKFKGLLANEMVDLMITSDEWCSCGNGVEAKKKADLGYLVLAGLKGNEHGHVAVVLPGEAVVLSGKWGIGCPQVANIGRTNFLGQGANYAFDAKPGYWYLNAINI
jgi:hypothetical protein